MSDEDARVRSSARLALAMLGEVIERPPADAAWIEQFANAATAAMLGEPTNEHTRVLVGAIATRAREPLPWNDGDLAGLARALLETIEAPMLVGALADIPDGDAARRLAVYDLAELMLRVGLRAHTRARAPGELTADQRAIVAALAARRDVWKVSRTARAARAAGIPDSPEAVVAWMCRASAPS